MGFVRKNGADTAALHAPTTVRATDAFSTLLHLIVASAVHRVYVVGGGNEPLGVVAIADVIRVLLAPVVVAHPLPTSPCVHTHTHTHVGV